MRPSIIIQPNYNIQCFMNLKIISQYKKQIRTKHRQSVMSEIRKQYLQQTLSKNISIQKLANFDHEQWQKFYESQKRKQVPIALLYKKIGYPDLDRDHFKRYFSHLDPSKLVNVLFMTEMKRALNFESDEFFKKTMLQLPHLKQQQFNLVKQASKFKNCQQIYLYFWCQYLKNSKISIEDLSTVQHYFFKWWNDEQLEMDLCLVSEICYILLKFNREQSTKQIFHIGTYLMQSCQSHNTYILIGKIFSSSVQAVSLICLQQCFPTFILKGLKDTTLNATLKIINVILVNPSYYKNTILKIINHIIFKLQDLVIYSQLDIHQQANVLAVLYNFIFKDLEGTQQCMKIVHYQKMISSIYIENLLDFVDLCTLALERFADEQLYEKILGSDDRKFIQAIKSYISSTQDEQMLLKLQELIDVLNDCVQSNFMEQLIYENIVQINEGLQINQNSQYLDKKSAIQDKCKKILDKKESL